MKRVGPRVSMAALAATSIPSPIPIHTVTGAFTPPQMQCRGPRARFTSFNSSLSRAVNGSSPKQTSALRPAHHGRECILP
jgi:hypothetical protein